MGEGEGCLGMRCPHVDPPCRMLVPLDVIEQAREGFGQPAVISPHAWAFLFVCVLFVYCHEIPNLHCALPPHPSLPQASPSAAKAYRRFLVVNYVHTCRQLTWCPGVDCEHAVECTRPGASLQAMDVHCGCGAQFCFRCLQEAHRPLDCATVAEWNTKNSTEAENVTWILVRGLQSSLSKENKKQ